MEKAPLTHRQYEVMVLHERGFKPAEIARQLGVTRQAVHQVLARLRDLGVVK